MRNGNYRLFLHREQIWVSLYFHNCQQELTSRYFKVFH